MHELNAGIQKTLEYSNTGIQEYRNTEIQEYRKHWNTEIQEYRNKGIQ